MVADADDAASNASARSSTSSSSALDDLPAFSWTIFAWQSLLPALLPPVDPAERDYYHVLGLTLTSAPISTSTSTLQSQQQQQQQQQQQHRGNGMLTHRHRKLQRIPLTEIRKAYRTKSLQLHPDKVAQRQRLHQRRQQSSQSAAESPAAAAAAPPVLTSDEAAAEFLLVQEAYRCLAEPRQRALYHQWHCSPARYRFWCVQQGHHNPVLLYQNLTATASCTDKTRLFVLVALAMLAVLVQPILIAIKVNSTVENNTSNNNNNNNNNNANSPSQLLQDAKWTVILIPTFVYWLVHVLGSLALVWLSTRRTSRTRIPAAMRWQLAFHALEYACWLIGTVIVAHAWDNKADALSSIDTHYDDSGRTWQQRFVPFYCAALFRLASTVQSMKLIRQEQAKMVSAEYLQQDVLPKFVRTNSSRRSPSHETNDGNDSHDHDDVEAMGGARLEDLTEAQQIELAKSYTVVTVDPHAVAVALQILQQQQQHDDNAQDVHLTAEDLEAIKVQSSSEFEQSEVAYQAEQQSLLRPLVVWIPMIALIGAKCQGDLHGDTSWWIVFLPIWLYLSLQWCAAAQTCCCTVRPPLADMTEQQSDDNHDDNNNNNNRNAETPTSESHNRHDETHNHNDESPSEPGSAAAAAAAARTTTTTTNQSTLEQPQPPAASKNNDNDGDDNDIQDESLGANMGQYQSSVAASRLTMQVGGEEQDLSSSSRDPSASVWASAEGDIEEFNLATKHSFNTNNNINRKQQSIDLKKNGDPVGQGASSLSEPNGDNNTTSNDENDNIDKDEDDDIFMDEDTFHAWQSVHEQAEQSAMERMAKAQATCCWVTFQFIMVCLIVGKLQQDYHNSNSDEEGYNAFVILIPIFLIVAVILCCCCCFIYGGNALQQTAGAGTTSAEAAATSVDAPVSETPLVPQSTGGFASTTASTTMPAAAAATAHWTTTEQQQHQQDNDSTTYDDTVALESPAVAIAPSQPAAADTTIVAATTIATTSSPTESIETPINMDELD